MAPGFFVAAGGVCLNGIAPVRSNNTSHTSL
jgi:hypothetical protein